MSDINISIILRAYDEASKVFNKVDQKLQETAETVEAAESRFKAFREALSVMAGMLLRDVVNSFAKASTEALRLGAEVDTLKAGFEALQQATFQFSL